MTARITFTNEDRKVFEGGIPTGVWSGKTRGVTFFRKTGEKRNGTGKYDIRKLRLGLVPGEPLSGEQVPDGKVDEVLGYLADEYQIRSIMDIGKVFNQLMDTLGVEMGEGDVEAFRRDLLATADAETGVVDYDAVKAVVQKYGKAFANKPVTFTLTHDTENQYEPYPVSNVQPAAG